MTEVEIAQDDEVIVIQADDAPSIVVMLDSETDVIQTLDVGPPGPQGEPGPAGPPSTVPGPAGPPGPAGVGIAGSAMPLMDGAAAIGVSAAWAHEDHRHPTDTSRAPLGSPTFIGVPAAPTAPPGTTTTQLATTAFVGAALTAAAVPAPATAAPVMDGVAAVGAATKYAREDHVHPSNTAKEDKANKGIALGYASLDASAKVPAAQLPSYVDDVLEFANLAAFPATGATGLIYVALDTNKIYRWSGSAYIEISPSPGSTDCGAGRLGQFVLHECARFGSGSGAERGWSRWRCRSNQGRCRAGERRQHVRPQQAGLDRDADGVEPEG